jgi:hypothetical protein
MKHLTLAPEALQDSKLQNPDGHQQKIYSLPSLRHWKAQGMFCCMLFVLKQV